MIANVTMAFQTAAITGKGSPQFLLDRGMHVSRNGQWTIVSRSGND